jgi:ribonucleoside-triphosphate reductase (formate)
MNEHRRDLPEDELPKSAPREGTFDAQLLFPTPFVEAPQPIQSIVKRDGRTAPFERAKIAAAIRRAGNGKGDSGAEHADSIANGVTLYLTKKLQGRTPSVEEVDDAVERVLIELGHAETALAYARHRDRRDRIRRFKDGDIDGVLREFEEARQESVAAAPPDALSLFVRTSDERLATWDRERIVDALIRETGMDATPARFIALQVERQILGAGVKTLTTSLVRELVDAKLIEFGLEDYRVRHRRLGVPLYDAERIICRPNERGAAYACDPAATDLVLAERVKREFALTQVFTREVADAHLRGDLHLHDLGFIDRLHEIVQPIEFVKLFGVRTDSNRLPHPPAFVNTLLSQIGAFNETLTNHFTNGVSWDAINVYLAPLTSSLNEKALDQVTRLLLVRLSGRAAHPCLSSPASELVLHWSVPRYLQDQHAVAARGEAPGQDYGQLAPYAREVARILLRQYLQEEDVKIASNAPVPCVRVSDAFFQTPGSAEFLEMAAEAAGSSGAVHFLFERRPEAPEPGKRVWQPRYTAVHKVTLNLARLAYRSGSFERFGNDLADLAALAAAAHQQKRTFIQNLLELKHAGPLGILASEHDGAPFIDLDDAVFLVGVTGLYECAQALTGKTAPTDGETDNLAEAVMVRLRELIRQRSDAYGMRMMLAETPDPMIGQRFASLDLQQFSEHARRVLKTDPITQDLGYTLGVRVAADTGISPIERARREGLIHKEIEGFCETEITMPDARMSSVSTADFVEKIFYQTRCRRLRLRPAM